MTPTCAATVHVLACARALELVFPPTLSLSVCDKTRSPLLQFKAQARLLHILHTQAGRLQASPSSSCVSSSWIGWNGRRMKLAFLEEPHVRTYVRALFFAGGGMNVVELVVLIGSEHNGTAVEYIK